ncbi:MAG: nuclear transport factor 2 family protein [Chitinophagaceae bacterium]
MQPSTSTIRQIDLKEACVNFMFSYQQKDVPAMLSYCSPTATVFFQPLGENGKGTVAELGKALWEGLIASFPDLDNTIDSTIANDEDTIRCQVVIRGTQQSDFADIINKRKGFESEHIFIFKLDGQGKISHIDIKWDHTYLKKQLGN